MSGADELGTELAAAQSATPDRVESAMVADVTPTGAVNLVIDGTLVLDVPCADSYRNRKAGDWVAVRRSAGQLVVMWRLGADVAAGTLNKASWGFFAPSSAYTLADTGVYFKRNDDGTVDLYFRSTVASEQAGVGPPLNRGQIVRANSSAAWFDGVATGQVEPAQGERDGAAAGAWFYGLGILDACTDLTVTGMWLRLVRTLDGPIERLLVNLYLHSHQTKPAGDLTLNEGPYQVGPVSPGGSIRVRVPADWIPLLAAGTRYGFAISASTGPYSSYEGPGTGALGAISGDVEVVYA